ncbi:MAG: hypothetical protein WKF73_22890 [Nocardioidaceae bacterium]
MASGFVASATVRTNEPPIEAPDEGYPSGTLGAGCIRNKLDLGCRVIREAVAARGLSVVAQVDHGHTNPVPSEELGVEQKPHRPLPSV